MFKKFYIILFSSMLAISAPTQQKIKINTIKTEKKTEDINKKTREYKVKSGDTLFSIAKKFKVSISDIKKINNLKSSSLIYPGNILKIPSKSYIEKAKKAVQTQKKTVYKVKKGDTLIIIAKKHKMKIEDVLKLNNIKKSSKLKPGMELNVYAKKEIIKKRKRVSKIIVRRGDTLWSIAKKYNISLKEIRILNPKLRRTGLKVGSILNVSKDQAKRLLKISRRKRKLKGQLSRYKRIYSLRRIRGIRGRGNQRIVRYAKRFLGTPYVWGASSGRAFDCSGFTQYVIRRVKGKVIPRVSRRQAYYGIYIPRSRLIGGDLVFFDTSRRRRGYVNHVGIYIGNNKFIHASSAKHRVIITSLNKPFYSQRFMWGRRIN